MIFLIASFGLKYAFCGFLFVKMARMHLKLKNISSLDFTKLRSKQISISKKPRSTRKASLISRISEAYLKCSQAIQNHKGRRNTCRAGGAENWKKAFALIMTSQQCQNLNSRVTFHKHILPTILAYHGKS